MPRKALKLSRKVDECKPLMVGLASNVANEALGNIRTVRAVSTEDVEFQRYNDHAEAALRAGVKDAWGGALTVALTSLLELGTSAGAYTRPLFGSK